MSNKHELSYLRNTRWLNLQRTCCMYDINIEAWFQLDDRLIYTEEVSELSRTPDFRLIPQMRP